MDSEERGTGLFTQNQRDYLQNSGGEGADTASERMKRQRIRERVRNGIRDFRHLESLRDDDLEQVFADLNAGEIVDGTAEVLRFVHRGLGNDIDETTVAVQRGIYGAERDNDGERVKGVTAKIDVHRNPDTAEIYSRFENGDALTPFEKGLLVEEYDLTDAELSELSERENVPTI